MKNTLMIFVDGVGIGEDDPEVNPFFKYGFKTFSAIFGELPHQGNIPIRSGDKILSGIDAVLGVEGLPQSGTGQTSIFAGINAQKIIGQHFGPYPYSTLIPILKEENIFQSFLEKGFKPAFVNAYPKIFFDYINSGKKRLSVTSLSCLMSGVKLRKAKELHSGKALSAEIDNSRWVSKLNYKLPIIKPKTAANRLIKLSEQNHFTLFEYFLSDHIGHGRIKDEFLKIFRTFDEFLFHILDLLPAQMNLIICSDHGNLENISIKTHTRNPAFVIFAGPNSEYFYNKIKRIDQIKKTIMSLYE
ncbi:MAG: alkaline phosphatase family protein [Melioribacteraceae bacterium]|nr:alkaline phosphatase family protein [Melioribacteraceae bacterium]